MALKALLEPLSQDARTDARRRPRHSALLRARLATSDELITEKTMVISISASGCAIRTTARLANDKTYWLDVPQVGAIAARIVWRMDDFNIDTFYRYGFEFERDLDHDRFGLILNLIR